MRTYTISIDLKVKRSIAHEEGKTHQTYSHYQINGRKIRALGEAAKVYTLARLRHLLERYEEYLKEKHKEYMAQWPPHSLFCEKRCCQRANNTYMRFLKKELVWGRDGHLR